MRKLALLAALLAPALFGIDTSKLKPTGYVNDFSHVLGPVASQQLELYAGNLERATGVQMAIVLVPTLDNEPIDDVANRLYREWGIGKKGKDEGLLILIATQDHKDRAEVGYGLEPIITDGYAGSVLRGIRPILRQGDYGGALLAAAQEFGQRIAEEKGVALGGAGQRPAGGRVDARPPSIPWPVLMGGFFLLMWIIGKVSGSGRGGFGGGSGFLTGMILGNMMGRGSSGWGGGGFGGSGGGGGGWGGFGGGDSGGGGASSDW